VLSKSLNILDLLIYRIYTCGHRIKYFLLKNTEISDRSTVNLLS